MSNTTVPQIIASSSDTYTSTDYPAPIRLQVRRDLGAGEVTAADIYLNENAAAEVITDLALALETTASYGALAAVILAELERPAEYQMCGEGRSVQSGPDAVAEAEQHRVAVAGSGSVGRTPTPALGTTWCSNSDHDGTRVPAVVLVRGEAASGATTNLLRCEYCSEGAVARLRRSGFPRIVIEAVAA